MYDRVYPPAEEEKESFKEPYEKFIEVSRNYHNRFTGLDKKERASS